MEQAKVRLARMNSAHRAKVKAWCSYMSHQENARGVTVMGRQNDQMTV